MSTERCLCESTEGDNPQCRLHPQPQRSDYQLGYNAGYLQARHNAEREQPPATDDAWKHKLADFVNLILHGDDDHKSWLREAGEAFILGKPIPPPRHRTLICADCKKGAQELERGYLQRVNMFGRTGVWLCTEHLHPALREAAQNVR